MLSFWCTSIIENWYNQQPERNSHLHSALLEFVFQEQSYSSLYSGWSLAWDHFRGDIDDPCGVIAHFCGVIADPCRVITDPAVLS